MTEQEANLSGANHVPFLESSQGSLPNSPAGSPSSQLGHDQLEFQRQGSLVSS